jgi:hypothetical protein
MDEVFKRKRAAGTQFNGVASTFMAIKFTRTFIQTWLCAILIYSVNERQTNLQNAPHQGGSWFCSSFVYNVTSLCMQINSGKGGRAHQPSQLYLNEKMHPPGIISPSYAALPLLHTLVCAFHCHGSARTPLFWRQRERCENYSLDVSISWPSDESQTNLWIRTISFRG